MPLVFPGCDSYWPSRGWENNWQESSPKDPRRGKGGEREARQGETGGEEGDGDQRGWLPIEVPELWRGTCFTSVISLLRWVTVIDTVLISPLHALLFPQRYRPSSSSSSSSISTVSTASTAPYSSSSLSSGSSALNRPNSLTGITSSYSRSSRDTEKGQSSSKSPK